MTTRQRLKLLGIVATGFVVPALAIIALQFVPATAKPLGYVLAPYHAGVLLQLMMLVIAGLAIIGEVPRWALVLPLATWIGGAGYWWFEREQSLDRLRSLARRIELAGKAPPIVVTGPGFVANTLAQNLVADFAVDDVYVMAASAKEAVQFAIGSGDACSTSPDNRRLRQPWQNERLKARDQCVVRARRALPDGGVEVAVDAPSSKSAATANGSTPFVFSSRADGQAAKVRIDIGQERAPLPFLLPIVGCWVEGPSNARNCVTGLARSPFLLNPDPTATGPARSILSYLSAGNNAYYVGGALGLQRRGETTTASRP